MKAVRALFIRGLPFSTYALRGEGGLKKLLISAYDKTDRLREMRMRGREGVKNFKNFAYVLNGSPLRSLTEKGAELRPLVS